MLRNEQTNQRICEVCRNPLPNQNSRYDTKTCGAKCRQQARRNRLTAERDAYYLEQRIARQKADAKNDARNAARRKKRKAAKRPRRSKP